MKGYEGFALSSIDSGMLTFGGCFSKSGSLLPNLLKEPSKAIHIEDPRRADLKMPEASNKRNVNSSCCGSYVLLLFSLLQHHRSV